MIEARAWVERGLFGYEGSAMSIDRSLKTSGNLTSVRSVMTRAERIEKLKADGKFDPKTDNPLKLPKTIPVVK